MGSMLLILLVTLWLWTPSQVFAGIIVQKLKDPVPLYETFVLQICAPDVTGSKFKLFPSVTFSKGERSFVVEGFFDGDGNRDPSGTFWLVRFMPDEEGTWRYDWSFQGDSGSGSFAVGPRTNPKNHGHVKHQGRFLIHNDGTAFYYRGANWPKTMNLRPDPNFNDRPHNDGGEWKFFTDEDWLSYINRIEETGHNGNYITSTDRLMNNDRESFDLAWLKRVDFAVETSAARGLYTFLGLMDTWGRSAVEPFITELESSKQLLDPWTGDTLQDAKQLYFRYIVARYAGYYNVLWELGNEMEHAPNKGSDFASAANRYYIPWIRQYDPYDLPITLSEDVWRSTDVDIGGFHQAQSISLPESLPIIHTEIVTSSRMWQNTVYTDPDKRKDYRQVMWKGMAEGGSGSVEATIMFYPASTFANMTEFLADPDIRNVMDDHGRLGTFLAGVSTPLFEMLPLGSRIGTLLSGLSLPSWLSTPLFEVLPLAYSGLGKASLQYRTRGKPGVEYVAYFYGGFENRASITLDIAPGQYTARWFSPSTGEYSTTATVSNGDQISPPWSNQYDVALHLIAIDTYLNASPP